MASGALWRRARRAAARPTIMLAPWLLLALAAAALASLASAAAPSPPVRTTSQPPVAVRLSGGVGPLGGFTVSASVNGGAPPVGLAVDSGSTLSFVEPLQRGRRPLPALGDPLPCDARSCPCDIACGYGCDLPLPAYAAGAFDAPPPAAAASAAAAPKQAGPQQQQQSKPPPPPPKQHPPPKQQQQQQQQQKQQKQPAKNNKAAAAPAEQQPAKAPAPSKAKAPAKLPLPPPPPTAAAPARATAASTAGRRRLALQRDPPSAAAVQRGAPPPRPTYRDPVGGNAAGRRCAFDAGYADGGGVEGYLYNAELSLGTRGSNGSLPATLVPLGATVAAPGSINGEGGAGGPRLPTPLLVADGFVGLGRAPSALQAVLQRSPEVVARRQQQQGRQQAGSRNSSTSVSAPADWVGPSSGHVGFCLGEPTGGAMLLGGASAAEGGRALLPRGARPAFAPLVRVKEDPWLWSVAGEGVRVLPRRPLPAAAAAAPSRRGGGGGGGGIGGGEGASLSRAYAAEASALAVAPPLPLSSSSPAAAVDARIPAFSFDTGTTSALVVPGAAAFANLTAALSRAVADANARLPEGAPQRLLPHGELCWLAQGAVATYEGAMARLAAQRAAEEIIREVKASPGGAAAAAAVAAAATEAAAEAAEAAPGGGRGGGAAPRRRLLEERGSKQQQPGGGPVDGPPSSGPPVIETVLGDDGGRAHGPSPTDPGARNEQRADGGGGQQGGGPGGGQGGPGGGGPPLGAGPPPAAIAAAAEKLGGLDAVDALALDLFPDLVLELKGSGSALLPSAPGGRGPRLRRIVVPAASYVLVPRRDRVDIDARFVDVACAPLGAGAGPDGGGGGGGGGAEDPSVGSGCDAGQREALSALALGRYCALISAAHEGQPSTTALVGAAGMRGAGVLLDDAPGEGTLGWAHGVDCTAAFGD